MVHTSNYYMSVLDQCDFIRYILMSVRECDGSYVIITCHIGIQECDGSYVIIIVSTRVDGSYVIIIVSTRVRWFIRYYYCIMSVQECDGSYVIIIVKSIYDGMDGGGGCICHSIKIRCLLRFSMWNNTFIKWSIAFLLNPLWVSLIMQ